MAAYKGVSGLPCDFFETWCAQELNTRVEELGARNFCQDENYYRMFWQVYLDNEQLLKEVQDAAGETHAMLERVCAIENAYED